jgi:CHAT domain-containing protein
VPDGPLFGLNLETLPGPGGHYWLEDATVMVTPSLDLLRSRPEVSTSNRSALLVGDAEEWDDEFPKLPNAKREIEGIQKSLRAEILSGPAASPTGYERAHPEHYGFIHLAAHATASRDFPLESAIILSRQGDSGKLSVKDVLALHAQTKLQAELVTLSACHSAGARTYAGEGLVGLAWAFLQSGAQNVIAGLWDVSDYSSPRLMEHLYAELANNKSPEDALRDAKLDLIHHTMYAHPFYWGAFQLYAGGTTRTH